MRVGEAARRSGATVKALRYYESLGLVVPARRANGYRDYDTDHVRMVQEIKALGALGIPAQASRPFLECLGAGHVRADDCPESLAGYRDAIHDLDARIAEMTGRRARLAAHLQSAATRTARDTEDLSNGEAMTDLTVLPDDLPEPRDDGGAAHLPGRRMPNLCLGSTSGGQVDLSRLGAGRTVLYLYPLTGRPGVDLPEGWDSIPGARGCTPEACTFRDHHDDLLAAGAQAVHGLSSQDTAYQREMVGRLHLPFSMLSDPGFELADALDLPTFTVDGMRLYRRQTLIVRDGVIEHVFYPVFPPHEHARQVLDWLAARAE